MKPESSPDRAAHRNAINARERLIVALDFPHDPRLPDRLIEPDDARRLIEELDGIVSFFKIGWPLYMAGGQALIKEFLGKGKRVFLDLKFGDIPETVKRLVLVAVNEGVSFITLNTTFEAARAAVEARGASDLKILMVTVLTSLDEADLGEMGFKTSVEEYVLYKSGRAREAGCDGVIASGREVRTLRKALGEDFLIVTPGIRPAGAGRQDHKRAVTPSESILAGADYLVLGRPVTTAATPRQAAISILEEMQNAFDARMGR
jgi:orotidine-5'-phosphate decarboxylase